MVGYESFKKLLFRLDPETAHGLAIRALQPLPAPRKLTQQDDSLAVVVAGIRFPSPIGLAAGFDKDAKAPGRLLGLGFGFVEVGTVTPRAQPGNNPPRLFRLEEDEAIINRFGFNSDGIDAIEHRLARRRDKPGIVGVNLGANKDTEDKIADYEIGVTRLSAYSDYLTINVSSPNTPGLTKLQTADQLPRLIERVLKARENASGPPVFLKVSPDLDPTQISEISRSVMRGGIDGLIVGNTTLARPAGLKSKHAIEAGGLSGRPLKPIALRALQAFRSEIGSRLPLIAVGGIESIEDVYERIRAGASLVQLYTAMAYKGPGLITQLNKGLVSLLKDRGHVSIINAVGADEGPNVCEQAA